MAKPVLLSRRTLAAGAAERWRHQYPQGREGIYEKLLALGSSPDPDDVDRLIGNTSWTAVISCDGCGVERPETAVRVGDEPDYESCTATLCGKCLKEALDLLEGSKADG